jgi:hypothetical protein
MELSREIDEEETRRRLDFYLDLDAELISRSHPHPILH